MQLAIPKHHVLVIIFKYSEKKHHVCFNLKLVYLREGDWKNYST